MSMYLMQFRAITVTWRVGIHHVEAALPVGGKPAQISVIPVPAVASQQETLLLRAQLESQARLFSRTPVISWLAIFAQAALFHCKVMIPTSVQEGCNFLWTTEHKHILSCCPFALAKHVLHVKMIGKSMCAGAVILNSDFKHCCWIKVGFLHVFPCLE